nr:hypothetical protein [Actinomycetes bacterium]
QARADDGGGIPGGAPVGATTFGGIYSFQLDGAGGPGTGNAARLALAVLALVIAGGAGVALARRAGA